MAKFCHIACKFSLLAYANLENGPYHKVFQCAIWRDLAKRAKIHHMLKYIFWPLASNIFLTAKKSFSLTFASDVIFGQVKPPQVHFHPKV